VQDALALYPLFAFLAVRFAISTVVLAPFAWRSVAALPRSGYAAGIGVGVLLAAAYGLQTAGLELTTVASTGFPSSGAGSEVRMGEGMIGLAAARRQSVRVTQMSRELSYSHAAQEPAATGAGSFEQVSPLPCQACP